ncbi:MAG: A/G-specific adenine glycosylase [Terriglobales bacterium]
MMRVPSGRAIPTQPGASLAGKDLTAFRRALLGWYDAHRRDLPWRKTRDAYRIWISEIMLQQTRVAAVLDHYRIFLERFPNIRALAAAEEDAVLAAWSGLGYYRRARNLHQCAKEIVQSYRGRFPKTAEELRNLPGIGRYTGAAIASIAFDEPVAVVDGNVERVLQRFFASEIDGKQGIGRSLKGDGGSLTVRQVWQQAQTLLATARPGDFNQAMMELGATVCLPREPRCASCPVRKWCVTQQGNEAAPGAIPGARRDAGRGEMRPSMCQVKKNIWCVLNQRNGDVRLVQRGKKSALMPGMWELPQVSEPSRPLLEDAQWRTFRHSITVTDYTVCVLRNRPLAGLARVGKGKWIAIESIPRMPITGLTRKILKASGII